MSSQKYEKGIVIIIMAVSLQYHLKNCNVIDKVSLRLS
jgi:hypothetical protein